MGLHTKKSGTNFGNVRSSAPEEAFAALCVKAAQEVNLKVETSLIARALGTISAEGGFIKGTNWTSNTLHQGPWALSDGFEGCRGSQRLDPWLSTLAAFKYIKKHGGNSAAGFGAWWPFEESQGETEGGLKRSGKYIGIAEKAIEASNSGGGLNIGEAAKSIPGVGAAIAGVEGVVGGAEDVVGAAKSAEEFLQEALETLLNFEKLGTLVVHAFAWFLRLLAKAIWDYVIAPLVHWTERAVTWYWSNFFATGTEQGSGFGYQIRNNAGIITIIFWSLGYAVLWSDGSGSFTPVASHNSMLGQAVKGIEGQIARRNLTKPDEVKKKTPKKPEPKKSTVHIEQVDSFAVSRNRPVKVTRPGEAVTGRKDNGSRRQTHLVPRPRPAQPQTQPQPRRGQREQIQRAQIDVKNGTIQTPAKATRTDRTGSVSRTASGARSKGSGGGSGKARTKA